MNRRPAHLTEREEQILACIRQSIADSGEDVTTTEIGAAVGLRSKGTVAYHLRNLQERGALVRVGCRRAQLSPSPLRKLAPIAHGGASDPPTGFPTVPPTNPPTVSPGRLHTVHAAQTPCPAPTMTHDNPLFSPFLFLCGGGGVVSVAGGRLDAS
ncbi:LexA family protein [Streptomyces tauricus]|uniref:LexA family protein n=1 Tax=Streptomyces tauricus TaxID=68274 RepID=UPI0022445302|nr:hypothetical protein [Streptomyces tauricus]MCW8102670.1 hypothetical protein [Streptomyces tauricus]